MVALEKASVVGGAAAAPPRRAASAAEEDALGTTGVERVAAQGCPHCAGREIVGWGRSHGLLRFRCKSCGRTFNTLTKTPMAHLRKKDRWLDHARAMIEQASPRRGALRNPFDDGVSLASSVSARPCKRQAPELQNRRSGRNLRSRILQGPTADLPRKARRRGGTARHPGLHQDNIPILVARDRSSATFDAILAQVDGASVSLALAEIVTPANHLISDGGKAIATFARRAGIAFHTVPSPGKPSPAAPHLHINNVNAYHGRLKQWLNRFNGVATKNLPNYLGGGALSKPGRQTRSQAIKPSPTKITYNRCLANRDCI